MSVAAFKPPAVSSSSGDVKGSGDITASFQDDGETFLCLYVKLKTTYVFSLRFFGFFRTMFPAIRTIFGDITYFNYNL